MVRKIFVIMLAISMLSLTLKDLVTYASFYVNQNFIAQTICKNRDKPKSKCHGKCFLKETIKENQEQESPFSNIEDRNNIVYPSIEEIGLFTYNSDIESNNLSFLYNRNYSFIYQNKIFQPPQV